jgi:hypothetical protein
MSNAAQVDFCLYGHGSISTLVPKTPAAKAWVEKHIPEDAQWFGHGVVIEHRYVNDIVEGLQADGLTIY